MALLVTGGASSVYDFKVPSLDGNTIDLAKYKGKKILIVNTASKCGFTPQYADLEKLYTTYQSKLVIVGFPANNFGQQEPGTAKEISELICRTKKKYNISSITITHDMACAKITADRIILLKDGIVYAEGSYSDLESSKDEWIQSFFNI